MLVFDASRWFFFCKCICWQGTSEVYNQVLNDANLYSSSFWWVFKIHTDFKMFHFNEMYFRRKVKWSFILIYIKTSECTFQKWDCSVCFLLKFLTYRHINTDQIWFGLHGKCIIIQSYQIFYYENVFPTKNRQRTAYTFRTLWFQKFWIVLLELEHVWA